MGYGTTASGDESTSFGYATTADGHFSTAMGDHTSADATYSIAMGYESHASGSASTAMGSNNTASGANSTVMGYYNTASGNNSIAIGSYANTNGQTGAFVYGDSSSSSTFEAQHPNEFDVRATGSVNLYTDSTLTTGISLPQNGGLSYLAEILRSTAPPTADYANNRRYRGECVEYHSRRGNIRQWRRRFAHRRNGQRLAYRGMCRSNGGATATGRRRSRYHRRRCHGRGHRRQCGHCRRHHLRRHFRRSDRKQQPFPFQTNHRANDDDKCECRYGRIVLRNPCDR